MVDFFPDSMLSHVKCDFERTESRGTIRFSGFARDLEPAQNAPWRSKSVGDQIRYCKSKSSSLVIPVPSDCGRIESIDLTGVFALDAGPEFQSAGSPGAVLEVWESDVMVERFVLVNGSHYFDAQSCDVVRSFPGDGTSLESIGQMVEFDALARVDRLRIELPRNMRPTEFTFRDLGTPASFLVFDVSLNVKPLHKCPFHPDSGGVSLSEIPSIVRIGDRAKMQLALTQLEAGVLEMRDLDEARGEALTFLAVVTAGTLEAGGSRGQHRLQLTAARELEALQSTAEIVETTRKFVHATAPHLFQPAKVHTDVLMDRALALIDRHYGRALRDSDVAEHVGLSTSHFRHLFRQATNQPFHKYLLALRLEKARSMICQEGMTVTDAARASGFCGLSHFSRAFTERFSVRPSDVKSAGTEQLH